MSYTVIVHYPKDPHVLILLCPKLSLGTEAVIMVPCDVNFSMIRYFSLALSYHVVYANTVNCTNFKCNGACWHTDHILLQMDEICSRLN